MTGMNEWNVGRLLKVSGSYWEACTLHAGVKLDIFPSIEAGDATAEETASRLESNVRAVTVLLNALAAVALIAKSGDRYANAPAGPFLSKNPLNISAIW